MYALLKIEHDILGETSVTQHKISDVQGRMDNTDEAVKILAGRIFFLLNAQSILSIALLAFRTI